MQATAQGPAPAEVLHDLHCLESGLGPKDVLLRLRRLLRLGDVTQRVQAHYLADVDVRGLHALHGCSSIVHYGERMLGMDRRRTRELVTVGRALTDLRAIDEAFADGRLTWSKVLLLVRIATPTHEAAWIERAEALSCRELDLEVRSAKPGSAPRAARDRKGLCEVRFHLRADVDVLTQRAWELARAKLAAEREAAVTDAEMLRVFAELFLQLEEDGSVPGRRPVPASLYRIVLRQQGIGSDTHLLVDTDDGPVPVGGGDDTLARGHQEAVCCDGDHVVPSGQPGADLVDVKTPPALRQLVLARDGQQCRHCRSRYSLMVHHVVYRSHGGPTRAQNLVTLCMRCHALVHADLLVPNGVDARTVAFAAPDEGELASVLRAADTALGTTLSPAAADAIEPDEGAFDGLVGVDEVVGRLEVAALAAYRRRQAFPHTLLVGPPGTGKTTLARAIAARVGARRVETTGSVVQDVPTLLGLLADLGRDDVLFLDEIHACPRPVLESLYQAMTERRVPRVQARAGRPAASALEVPRFTLVGATTEEGELPHALHGRFGLREQLAHYETEDLAALVTAAAEGHGVRLEAEAARRLARAARGTPREALRLAERVLDSVFAGAVDTDVGPVQADTVTAALATLGYDAEGLDANQQRYLGVLRSRRTPVALSRLARWLGLGTRTITEHIEPFLFFRGLVEMTSRGRIAAPRAPG